MFVKLHQKNSFYNIIWGCIFIAACFIITFNNINYVICQEEGYTVKEYSTYKDELSREAWMVFKKDNPVLYQILMFFNPPILNNIFAFIITIVGAIGSLFFLFAFEGGNKVILILLSLYCWGRIVCFFITMSLIAKGIIPY